MLYPLAASIDGSVIDGRAKGSFHGYGVDASAHHGFPIMTGGGADIAPPPADVDTFRLTLSGVEGKSAWHCQSSPGGVMHAIAAQVTAGKTLRAFQPGDFKFEGVDIRSEAAATGWLSFINRLGIPVDTGGDAEALHSRLIAAGLFDELVSLRWGGHPYLPKVSYTPPARVLLQAWLQSDNFTRSTGLPDMRTAITQHIAEVDRGGSGRLTVEVEMGNALVPGLERFSDLLESAIRIAEINLRSNPPHEVVDRQ